VPTYIQNDIRFSTPPPGAAGLNALTVKEYLPKDGKLTIVSSKGAEPHYIHGENFRIHVGKKPSGRHSVAMLFAADPFLVRHKKQEDLVLDSGVYYIAVTGNGGAIPIFQ